MSRNFLLVDPEERADVLRGLASPVRVKILRALHMSGGLNVIDIASRRELPQSTVSSNLQIHEEAGLIKTETQKARKGNQKICRAIYDEVQVMFKEDVAATKPDLIEVAMPLGLCSSEGIIGLLDVPVTFLDPGRMRAGLMWFTRGFIEYQFPNYARLSKTDIEAMEFSFEISSEVPGTATDWPSDITVTVNLKDVGTWTSPGDFGDQRGVYTPDWWTLRGSQYGMLKTWRITREGSFVDGVKISHVSL